MRRSARAALAAISSKLGSRMAAARRSNGRTEAVTGEDAAAPAPKPPPLRPALDWAFASPLAGCTAPHTVLLVEQGGGTPFRKLLAGLRPEARLEVLPDLEGTELHLALTSGEPLDLLVDRSGEPATADRIRRLIGYLRVGGVLIAEVGGPGRARAAGATGDDYVARVAEAAGCAAAMVRRFPKYVTVVNGRGLRPVLREPDIRPFLERRPDVGRVLELRPPRHVATRGGITATEAAGRGASSGEWTVPTLALREYDHAVSAPGGIVTAGGLVMPETFRDAYGPVVHNRWLADEPVQWFVGADERGSEAGARRLPGSYFHLDSEVSGQFGPTVTEILGRLWGWEAAKREHPDLKALLHAGGRAELADWEVALFEAAGLVREDIVLTDDPVRVDRLVGATSMFGSGRYVHPDLVETWGRVAAELTKTRWAGSGDVPERIFVGSPAAAGPDHAETEASFAERGYTVVHPGDHSLPDQVRLFRNSAEVAGFSGNGMLGLMWASEPKPVTIVPVGDRPAGDELLIAAVIGHHVTLV